MRRDYGYFEEDQLGKPYDLKLLRRLFPFVRPYSLLFLLSIFLVTGISASMWQTCAGQRRKGW
ncbi:MAG: hypothetical protein JRI70_11060 [Deltaproteobacteria bacterium]|nr:hypothetical protein [Deltaproteobacteria bacterium]